METGQPDKVCGIHFFNPAPVMSLVEVVRPITAWDKTHRSALSFAETCGKSPVERSNASIADLQHNALHEIQQRKATQQAQEEIERMLAAAARGN